MWPDNDTDRDFVNFTSVAETVAEIVVQAAGRPISIGVSGAWGTGKSSLIRLTHEELKKRKGPSVDREFIFVEFNAWLYQGYDDARAALMEVIASTLESEAKTRGKGLEQATSLLKRVNWLRAAKLTASSAMALSLGLPPMGLIGEAWKLGEGMLADGVDESEVAQLEKLGGKVANEGKALVKPKAVKSPPKEIDALRKNFEDALEKMEVTLIVLIDDLDRCLPETTISTLEAIRLFLFLKNAAFVIAADTDMIKYAVRHHFKDVDDKLVTSYFDKLIQVPIRVPPLGTQEVRAYMILLFIENSDLAAATKDTVRSAISDQLKKSWQGARVDRAFVEKLHEFSPELIGRFDTADRLAPIMTSSIGIQGNPRLIKRFLNALSIRMSIAKAHGVGVDEAVLAKMLLFERLGGSAAYDKLHSEITASDSGKPTFLGEWEQKSLDEEKVDLPADWDQPFVREWLALPPRLADIDLRGALYVSREHAPLIMPSDRLSSEGADLLNGMLTVPDMAGGLKQRLSELSAIDLSVIVERLLERAGQETQWGTPAIMEALLVMSQVDSKQGVRVAAFLQNRPINQIMADIVPRIEGEPWGSQVCAHWEKNPALDKTVRKAIETRRAGGHFAVK